MPVDAIFTVRSYTFVMFSYSTDDSRVTHAFVMLASKVP